MPHKTGCIHMTAYKTSQTKNFQHESLGKMGSGINNKIHDILCNPLNVKKRDDLENATATEIQSLPNL